MSAAPASSSEALEDFQIEGKYQVFGPILGRGAWSAVRRCEPLGSYRPPNFESIGAGLVVKMIDKNNLLKQTRGDVTRAEGEIERELATLGGLPPHPNIAVFVESIKADAYHYLIFEAAPNGDLCEKILSQTTSKLDETIAKRYTFQMVNAVLHCHKNGIAHRDLKPENMLLGDDDELKLTDFGLAKFVPSSSSSNQNGALSSQKLNSGATFSTLPTVSEVIEAAKGLMKHPALGHHSDNAVSVCSEVVGTPRYGAPEMFEAKSHSGHYNGFLADSWSLGVVVYIMLTGSFPFSPSGNSDRETFDQLMKTPLHIPAGVSAAATDFMKKLLNKDPAKRLRLWEALDHEWLEEHVLEAELKQHQAQHCSEKCPGAGEMHPLVYQQLLRLHRRETMMALRKTLTDPLPTSPASILPRKATGPMGASGRQPSPATRKPVSSPAPSPTRRVIAGSPTRVAPGERTPITRSPGPVHRAATPVRKVPAPTATTTTTATVPARSPSSGTKTTTTVTSRTPPSSPIHAPAPKGVPSRTQSPLARSSPTVRRGTPLRTTAASASSSTPGARSSASSSTPGARSSASTSTPASRIPPKTMSPSPVPKTTSSTGVTRSATPTGAKRPAGSLALRSPLPTTASSAKQASSPPPILHTTPIGVGNSVTYKGKAATVRFRGETGFAPGLWLGLEMKEPGGEGLHDGRSFVDKVRYFECAKGHGVFVRESQVTKKE